MRTICSLALLAGLLVTAAPAAAFRGTVPPGWSRVGFRLTTTTLPIERYAVASFPLRRAIATGCGPSQAIRAQMPSGGAIVIVVSWGPAGSRGAPLGRPVRLGRIARLECFGRAYAVDFTAADEHLQGFVVVRGTPTAGTLSAARAVLARVRR